MAIDVHALVQYPDDIDAVIGLFGSVKHDMRASGKFQVSGADLVA